MALAEKLITDFSGVYIDYLLVNKPMCFFLPDMAEYKESRGFAVESLEDYLPGKIVLDFSKIKDFINENDEWKLERKKLRKLFHDVVDGTSCRRTFDIIFGAKEG